MINRICISINNRCNLHCKYCHFNEKNAAIHAEEMDVFQILEHVKTHIRAHNIPLFKIGFVGNGEPLLDYEKLKSYILYIDSELADGRIAAYTISNGLLASNDKLLFLENHHVNIGFSIDGIPEIHNKLRCQSFAAVMDSIERYHALFHKYPSMNCTVGQEVLAHQEETIDFFVPFQNRITFSRMIGRYGISLDDFHQFLDKAAKKLNVRFGGYDCTMYGGQCGAGMNNYYFANNKVYICGNCIDLFTPFSSATPLDQIQFNIPDFNRHHCYKEMLQH